MPVTNTDRLQTRLLAIDIRLFELNREMERTQIQVHHLEAQLEDARLAHMIGDNAGDATEIGSALESSRGSLESQRALIDSVKKNQWKARVDYTMARVKERRDERARQDAE